nr:hypothetical protein [Candidatus Sigynarchaeota archaeon]
MRIFIPRTSDVIIAMFLIIPVAGAIIIYVGAKSAWKKAQIDVLARLNSDLALLQEEMIKQKAKEQEKLDMPPTDGSNNDPSSRLPPDVQVASTQSSTPKSSSYGGNGVTCSSCGAEILDHESFFCGICGKKL